MTTMPALDDAIRPANRLERLLTRIEVSKVTSLNKTTIYRRMRGTFPRPISLSDNRVTWRVSAITHWLGERERVVS